MDADRASAIGTQLKEFGRRWALLRFSYLGRMPRIATVNIMLFQMQSGGIACTVWVRGAYV